MALRLAIVGCGPKGLYALERLLHHADAADLGAHVDVFEPHPEPGAGPVYATDQPPYLRMNLAADQVDMWCPGSRAVPAEQQRSFAAWRGAGGNDYPPRALVGRYLVQGFDLLCGHAPPGVTITLRPLAVDGLRRAGSVWRLSAPDGAAAYDEVMLATGHRQPEEAVALDRWPHAAPLVAGVFPTGERLGPERVPPGCAVAVRGFALTFLDAALALTEGRGGRFEPAGAARLRYRPGPRDVAVILPYSRSGRPMLAKPEPHVVAQWDVAAILQQGRADIAALPGPLDLRTDVLAVLAATTTRVLAAMGGEGEPPEPWLLRACSGAPARRTPPPAQELRQSLDAGGGSRPADLQTALGHCWRGLYPALVAGVGADGLTDRAWPAWLRLAAAMERIAFGPPPVNAAKLEALIEAGRVDLDHVAGGAPVTEHGTTRLGERAVDVVVDAVLPGPGWHADDRVAAHLVATGQARVRPGRRGLDVTADARCVGADGAVTPGLAALGRLTEDAVVGNDTLIRSLHPQADRWASSVVERAIRRSASARAAA